MHLRDLFFATTIIAAYLALRQLAISIQAEQVIAYGILAIGLLVAIVVTYRNAKLSTACLCSGLAAMVLSGSWALECVFHSPATAFLRQHRIQASYSTDPQINIVGVIVITAIVTLGSAVASLYLNLCRGRKPLTKEPTT